MRLLIDGYNLLHVTDLFGVASAVVRANVPESTPLARSRAALLSFLAGAVEDRLRPRTTIVFDAHQAPPGLPQQQVESEMTVRFARGYPSADALIEEMIEACRAPRELTVVSSDHRLHRAARLRGATAIDSDIWYRQLREAGRTSPEPDRECIKPPPPTDPADIRKWLDEFT